MAGFLRGVTASFHIIDNKCLGSGDLTRGEKIRRDRENSPCDVARPESVDRKRPALATGAVIRHRHAYCSLRNGSRPRCRITTEI